MSNTEATNQLYQRLDAEAKEGRAALIARYKSLVREASAVRSASLATQYQRAAMQLRSRHNLTDEEVS